MAKKNLHGQVQVQHQQDGEVCLPRFQTLPGHVRKGSGELRMIIQSTTPVVTPRSCPFRDLVTHGKDPNSRPRAGLSLPTTSTCFYILFPLASLFLMGLPILGLTCPCKLSYCQPDSNPDEKPSLIPILERKSITLSIQGI